MQNIEIDVKEGKNYRVRKSSPTEKFVKSRYGVLNFVCLCFFTISAFITLSFCISSFIHKIYAQPKAYINESGVIVSSVNNKAVALWLYNPNQVLRNSGIRVSDGDKIRINASGRYHSDIDTDPDIENGIFGLVHAARENVKPTYPWVSQYNQESKSEEEIKMENNGEESDAILAGESYGTLLVSVMDRFDRPETDSEVLDFSRSFDIRNVTKKKLCLKNIFKGKILTDTTYTVIEDLEPAYRYRNWKKVKKDGTLHFIINDTKDKQADYSDNMGETLVSVEITYAGKHNSILAANILIMLLSGSTPYLVWSHRTKRWKNSRLTSYLRTLSTRKHKKH